ncbi:MAG: hypothetical protein JSU94_13660 [Phycisphaerales bacterium]|nr:MAG: hypothetical protein JSU94_13660 [Phycisphaerales bacterium]
MAPDMLRINVAEPFASAEILDGYGGSASHDMREARTGAADVERSRGEATSPDADPTNAAMRDIEAQKAELSRTLEVSKNLIERLSELYNTAFSRHREEIAKLSVEIARKILVQQVDKGGYQIESIVREALKKAPRSGDIVIHLNPQDLSCCQKAQKDGPRDILAGAKLVPDANVGRAECLIESPKGIVESFINEHLELIGKALVKAK